MATESWNLESLEKSWNSTFAKISHGKVMEFSHSLRVWKKSGIDQKVWKVWKIGIFSIDLEKGAKS